MMQSKQVEGYEVGFLSPSFHQLKDGHQVKTHPPLLLMQERCLWGTSQPLDGVNCLPEPRLPSTKHMTFIYVKLLTVWRAFRNLFGMALNRPFPFLISAWEMDTLSWVSISDTSYILSLARSYFKLSIRGQSYLCHCQNSSKGPVTLMIGLLEAKGSAVTQIGSAALSASERKASCTSFLSPLATASCQQKLLPSQGWKGRDVHLQSWGWTSFVWGGSCQSKECSCAF